jgi:hypothetical protein
MALTHGRDKPGHDGRVRVFLSHSDRLGTHSERYKGKPNLPKKPQFMPNNSHVLRQTDHFEVRLGLRSHLPFWLHLSAPPLRVFFVHCLPAPRETRFDLHFGLASKFAEAKNRQNLFENHNPR